MNFVSDALAIVQAINKLYRKGYVVARDAPRDVRDAVDDIDVLGRTLYELRKKMEGHGDNPQPSHDTLAICVQRCSQAVNEFEVLLQQFRKFSMIYSISSSSPAKI